MNSGFRPEFGYNGNWFCGPGAFFPGPIGWILTLLFWALLIYLVIILFKAIFFRDSKGAHTSLENLKKRYARGEISKDEYNRIKAELI